MDKYTIETRCKYISNFKDISSFVIGWDEFICHLDALQFLLHKSHKIQDSQINKSCFTCHLKYISQLAQVYLRVERVICYTYSGTKCGFDWALNMIMCLTELDTNTKKDL